MTIQQTINKAENLSELLNSAEYLEEEL